MRIDPSEVRWVPVDEAGDVRMGKQLSPASRKAPNQHPYLRVANVHDDRIDFSDVNTMGFSDSECATYALRRGDILLNEGQSLDLVGRSAIFDGPNDKYFFQNTLVRYRANDGLEPRYAQLVFRQWLSTGVFASIAKKTTSIAHLGSDRFARLKFPLIPLARQHEIVEAVNSVAETERSMETSMTKLRKARSALMHAIFDQSSWPRHPLAELAEISSGTTPSRSRRDFWDSGSIPWVRTGEINFADITETGEHITPKAVHESNLKIHQPGTVLLAMYGEGVTRGRSARLGVAATTNQAAAAIACNPGQLDDRFLQYWLEQNYEQIRLTGQGSNQSNLNCSAVASLRVPRPPFTEQIAAIRPLRAVDNALQTSAAHLAKLTLVKEGMMTELLPATPQAKYGHRDRLIT